jgi:hypothetical protein
MRRHFMPLFKERPNVKVLRYSPVNPQGIPLLVDGNLERPASKKTESCAYKSDKNDWAGKSSNLHIHHHKQKIIL